MRMINIIFPLLVFIFSISCKGDHYGKYQLPESVERSEAGSVNFITSAALMDSIKHGANIALFFLKFAQPEDPAFIVQLPGMKTVELYEINDIARKLPKDKPLYLICLYGDDSKRSAERMAKDGIDCYYLDGGSYRLWEEMQRNQWSIPPGTIPAQP